ncbi:MAG TPA: flavodoxin-dependent (E)-4-hydroxy-3-methylbut-2-enyl-diphosphate synthase [Candidatus Marinimicrobia bacterium]|nr:flavodoxin-dependent (E)-4-hydroxy-3-methylbut-2-enyl-diphosphate synthase [Candidatus Neomarinimicrobiota bacterium]
MKQIRRKTRKIKVGNLYIGGDAPISVQSMCTTKTEDASATITQIQRLTGAGCQIARVTVPSEAAAKALPEIRKAIQIPLVADIHFNYKMALMAVDSGVDKIRINPGNIGSKARVKEVLKACQSAGIPIRIGINTGSLEKDILQHFGYPTAEAMVLSARRHLDICEEHGFENVILALKSSNVKLMIEANRLFSQRYDYPLHLGVTEAGPTRSGTIKSAIGIGTLLAEGIGDTIRVSLTDDPEEELKVGFEILKNLGLASGGVNLISCPTCGRLEVDLFKIVREIELKVSGIKKDLTVAVMGCAVNGPGEAAEADIGIACGKGGALFYIHGKKSTKVKESEIVPRLLEAIDNYKPKEKKGE